MAPVAAAGKCCFSDHSAFKECFNPKIWGSASIAWYSRSGAMASLYSSATYWKGVHCMFCGVSASV